MPYARAVYCTGCSKCMLSLLTYITCGDSECTVEEVLIFCTEADRIPPLGFDKVPKLIFLESETDKMLPTASTCSIELYDYLHVIHIFKPLKIT